MTQAHMVVLRSGDKELGIEIANVREITKMMDIAVIHEPAGFIQGVVNLRGKIVAVVDLAKQLGLASAGNGSGKSRIVFVEFRNKVFGLIVDQVADIVRSSKADKTSVVPLDLEKFFSKFVAG